LVEDRRHKHSQECKLMQRRELLSSNPSIISCIVKLLEFDAMMVSTSEIPSSCFATERLSSRDSGTF
jgi:hypothetical protein